MPTGASQRHRTLTVGFFGTSIMEHLEAFNAGMVNQGDLPAVGSTVTVEGWRRRGWVHRLALSLRAAWPHVGFEIRNHGQGGATSRDIAGIVERDQATGADYDLVFLGCGINDVWRRFQNRLSEAVDLDEYTQHLEGMLGGLGSTRTTIVMSETPFGPLESPGVVAAMNAELARYNKAARAAAAAHGALFLDVWAPFTAAARHLAPADGDNPVGLWSDGVHLTELGDTLLLQQVERLLAEHRIIDRLLDSPLPDRGSA
ncbi:SGNH/GDSL hydrolase family protein [Kitasatospora sp. NPDC006697]|uniref:SGNH/GDSL hydrolase family protein n=1 Tax=Kitasatospora sp. NPDC006697 TaxID=3364020 RepID=UPI0036944201